MAYDDDGAGLCSVYFVISSLLDDSLQYTFRYMWTHHTGSHTWKASTGDLVNFLPLRVPAVVLASHFVVKRVLRPYSSPTVKPNQAAVKPVLSSV